MTFFTYSRLLIGLTLTAGMALANDTGSTSVAYLVKYKNHNYQAQAMRSLNKIQLQSGQQSSTTKAEALTPEWVKITGPLNRINSTIQSQAKEIEYIQPDYQIKLLEDYQIKDPKQLEAYQTYLQQNPEIMIARSKYSDNPAIKNPLSSRPGRDPFISRQWGMLDIGAPQVWQKNTQTQPIIVAVIDSGVDYNHPDLSANMWRNPGETGLDAAGNDKATNHIDDDGNGFVDDVVGYDFQSNDPLPYDRAVPAWRLLLGGGNPGHGTHCAGNIAARGDNSIGISGVAPHAKIMALRFIGEKGQGSTSGAIKAIKYAVDNGAKVLSNSWGSEGEDPSDAKENKALRDIIAYAQSKGVLFIAAAGNGHQGRGYSNDTDPRPAYPA
ncbi:MAG: S8 family serine peptidase, partial [Bdellovibrionales bacterium]|nr:S8 family serine peptidase [Bdellovibrionales bacterium]